jgi:hypothetical protein
VLTVGPAASEGEPPDWEVDVDFNAGTFVVSALSDAVPENLDQALRVLGPYRFSELRRAHEGERVRIKGTFVQVLNDEPPEIP